MRIESAMQFEKLAKKWKQIMVAKGISQSEMARLLRVNPSTISRWLKGERTPSLEMLDKIYELLGCTFTVLYNEEKKYE